MGFVRALPLLGVTVKSKASARRARHCAARLPRGCRLSAVVKSEAYGHGMLQVARAAVQAGAHELVVATVLEGAALRAETFSSSAWKG